MEFPLEREETIAMPFIPDSTETGFDTRFRWLFRWPKLAGEFRKGKTTDSDIDGRTAHRDRAKTAPPAGHRFDNTRWSVVLRAGGSSTPASRTALAELCRIYRPPLTAF